MSKDPYHITPRFELEDTFFQGRLLVEDSQGNWVRWSDYAVLYAKWIGAEKFASCYQMKIKELESKIAELEAKQ